jgi:L-ascorbate metabolism protein UlaG (beta-lactamase superfamily)
MKIRWIGHAAFYIETSQGLRIRTDPYDKSVGLPLSKLLADVVTVSHGHYDHNATGTVPGKPRILQGPIEEVVVGADIRGIPAFHDAERGTQRGANTIFVISADGITLAHMGDLGHQPTDEQIDDMGEVDVLCVPVGGVYTLDAQGADDLIARLQPAIAIPMHYKIPGLKVAIADAGRFREGKANVREAEELDVNADTLPGVPEVVILSPRP